MLESRRSTKEPLSSHFEHVSFFSVFFVAFGRFISFRDDRLFVSSISTSNHESKINFVVGGSGSGQHGNHTIAALAASRLLQ